MQVLTKPPAPPLAGTRSRHERTHRLLSPVTNNANVKPYSLSAPIPIPTSRKLAHALPKHSPVPGPASPEMLFDMSPPTEGAVFPHYYSFTMSTKSRIPSLVDGQGYTRRPTDSPAVKLAEHDAGANEPFMYAFPTPSAPRHKMHSTLQRIHSRAHSENVRPIGLQNRSQSPPFGRPELVTTSTPPSPSPSPSPSPNELTSAFRTDISPSLSPSPSPFISASESSYSASPFPSASDQSMIPKKSMWMTSELVATPPRARPRDAAALLQRSPYEAALDEKRAAKAVRCGAGEDIPRGRTRAPKARRS